VTLATTSKTQTRLLGAFAEIVGGGVFAEGDAMELI
jgi:hypothetical protein